MFISAAVAGLMYYLGFVSITIIMLICAMIIDYWMCGKLNIPFVDIKAVNAPMLLDINTKSGDTLTLHHYWLSDSNHPFTNNSVALGQQRYALAVYKSFINIMHDLL